MKKILYVDDEIVNLQLFKLAFKKKYQVNIALSGKEALEMLIDENDISIIFSDMQMPEIDGIEFIKKAKDIKPQVPCFILSGYSKNKKILEALEENLIIDYLMKPFDHKELISIIEKYSI